jgi:flagellar hook-associated protein 2
MTNLGALSGGGAGGITGQLDVQWIVEQIIFAKQHPVRELETYEIFYEAKKEAFQELNTRVSAVESALYTLNSSGFAGKTATAGTEDYFTAAATTTASTGTYSIVVNQLAQAESYTADNVISDADDNTIFDALGSKEFTITPRDGSGARTIDVTGLSLNQLKVEINSLDIDVTAAVIQYDTDDYRLVVTADETGEDQGFTLSGQATGNSGLDMDQKIANQDAEISVNNPGTYISRSSNTISDVINGVTLTLKDADNNETTTLTITADTTGLKENIQAFADAFNDAVDFLNQQFTFDEDSERSGVLSGESAAVKIKNDLLSIVSSRVEGIDASESYKALSLIGLELDRTGHLEIDDEKLDDAIANHFDSVKRLFTDQGTTTNSEITFIGSSDDTVGGSFLVHIDTAPEQALVDGAADIAATLTEDETLTITYRGTDYDVNLTTGMSDSDVVNAINTAMDDNEVAVSAQLNGSKLEIFTDAYGSTQSLQVVSDKAANPAANSGIGTTIRSDTGVDVAGTIGGNAASGSGRLLTGTAGNSNGLIVSVSTLSVGGGGEDKGTVYFTRGVGETLRERMYEHSFPYTGLIAKNISALDHQLDNISDKIAQINRNLESEAEALIKQFTQANEALAQMTYLQSTLSNNFTS